MYSSKTYDLAYTSPNREGIPCRLLPAYEQYVLASLFICYFIAVWLTLTSYSFSNHYLARTSPNREAFLDADYNTR